MIKNLLLITIIIGSSFGAFAQYSTSGTGQTYDLSDLVNEQILSLTDGVYYLDADLLIQATDSLLVYEDAILNIAPSVQLNVAGVLRIQAPNEFLMQCA